MARESVDERMRKLPELPTSAAASREYLELTMGVLHRHGAVLGELRTRTSIVLSATGIIASLLGAAGLEDAHPEWAVYIAIVCLVLGIGLCIAVLWPVSDEKTIDEGRRWQVTPTPAQVAKLAAARDDGSGVVPDDVLRELVKARFVNYDTIDRLTKRFNVACVLLLAQLIAWVVVFHD